MASAAYGQLWKCRQIYNMSLGGSFARDVGIIDSSFFKETIKIYIQ